MNEKKVTLVPIRSGDIQMSYSSHDSNGKKEAVPISLLVRVESVLEEGKEGSLKDKLESLGEIYIKHSGLYRVVAASIVVTQINDVWAHVFINPIEIWKAN